VNATRTYTAHHQALRETARWCRPLHPFDVRVVVALHERGGKATIAELADDLADAEGAAVRRSRFRLALHDFATMDEFPKDSALAITAQGTRCAQRFMANLHRQGPCINFQLRRSFSGLRYCGECGWSETVHGYQREDPS
jgi:hypothetical protein